VRLNGVPSISTGIIRNATANPLEVADGVRPLMPQIQRDLPPSVTVVQANDLSVFIDRSIKAVYTTVAEAVVLVALVVFVFLRTLRASFIPLVTIPVSLIGAFALIALAGFTVNTLTLLALVLAIGLVVDDAIVVLENIFRHIEEGLTPFQAALKGVREISFAVVAMTLTLAAVFAPLAFTPGRTGRLFSEFALTLAGAVLVSGFVALTLTPMMCSKLLRHNPEPNRFDRGMERLLVGLTRGYTRALRWVAGAPLGGGAGDAGLGRRQLVAVQHGQERTGADGGPRRDLHAVRAPDGATLEYTARYLDAIEASPRSTPSSTAASCSSAAARCPAPSRDAHHRLGRAHQEHAGTGARCCPGGGAARHQRLPDHAAQPGPGLPRAADQLRHRQRRQLRQHGAWARR
jgi:multidrug efflux pump